MFSDTRKTTAPLYRFIVKLACRALSRINRFRTDAVLTCTNGVSPNHLPVIVGVASDRP